MPQKYNIIALRSLFFQPEAKPEFSKTNKPPAFRLYLPLPREDIACNRG
jgi:hypothetical protein